MMDYWKGKVVIVTGGSAGLGFEIAKEFLTQGASVRIIARHQEMLDTAVERLNEFGNIRGHAADVTQRDQVQSAFAEILKADNQIDALINNVGKSTRVKIENADAQCIGDLININLNSVVNCSLEALPSLQKSSGHLVNIGSLASKTAWPFMTPYTISKFAVAAYTDQLRMEGPKEIHYMLVCPGPILREDSKTRYANESSDIPEAAKKPGGGANIKGIPPTLLAKKIALSCQQRKREIIYPIKSKLLFLIQHIWPSMGDRIVRKMIK